MKKRGKDPHGTHAGSSKLTRLSVLSIFLWLGFIILYLIMNNIIENIIPFSLLSNDIIKLIGMILISFGFIFEILGIIALGINFRIELPKDDIELIIKGVYRIMRNPIVLGVFLLVVGTILIIPNLLSLIICIFNIITFDSKVRDEEKFLSEKFGEEYKLYILQVSRYIPYKIRKRSK